MRSCAKLPGAGARLGPVPGKGRAEPLFAMRQRFGERTLPRQNPMSSTELRNFSGLLSMPLLGGDRGVEQTIVMMRQLVDDAVKDPQVNRLAIEILRSAGAPSFDREAKARAIYEWVQRNFLYVEDPVGPFGPKETLRPVRTLLQLRAGDCDDFVVILAALCGTIGIPTRIVTIAADAQAPQEFSHVYSEAELYPGMWVSLDAARPGAEFGLSPKVFFRKRVWSLTEPAFQDVNGQRMTPLSGYQLLGRSRGGLGQGQAPSLVQQLTSPEEVSAVGQAVANVEAAAHGSPYGLYATPYTPAAYAAGYPSSALTAPTGISITGGSWGILILAVAAIGLMAWGRRGSRY
jgi:hypothetical protein